jgi:predicted amidohydrolase YtcJ
MTLVDKVVPQIPDTMALRYFKQTEQICLSLGLTGVHDCGVADHTVDLLRRMDSLQQLQIKVFAMLSDDSVHYTKWLKQGPLKMPHVHVGGFKVYADGALGSRGACLLAPYSDDKQWHGFLLSDTTHFKNLATRLAQTPFQMCTHAIGDSANRFMLQTYARVLKGKNNKRWRIEHAQVVNDADFHWFGDFNIIPSVQPTHATSDMYWAAMRLGEKRMAGAYAYKRLLDQNHRIPLGTDFPVEDISPIKTFYAAVFRKDKNNYPAAGFQTENALSREEALRGMSIWAAYAAFEENEKGSLEKNKAADFLVLDTDILRCAEKDVLQTKVLATYVNGKLVFSNN